MKAKYYENLLKALPIQELLQAYQDPEAGPGDLTFIAEWIGIRQNESPAEAFTILLKLLNHDRILVREGAIYGLQNFPPKQTLPYLKERLSVEEHKTIKMILEWEIKDLESELSENG